MPDYAQPTDSGNRWPAERATPITEPVVLGLSLALSVFSLRSLVSSFENGDCLIDEALPHRAAIVLRIFRQALEPAQST